MNIEIILRDSDGRQTERLIMDYEPSDLYLSLTHDDGTPAEGFIEAGARYTPPGPQPNAFGIKLEARADNLTRELGAPVIARDPTGAADAEFLRGLGAILIGFDGQRLREAADRFDALEQERREIHLLADALITVDDSDMLGDLVRIRELAAEHKS